MSVLGILVFGLAIWTRKLYPNWLLIGAGLSLLPAVGAPPTSRMLLVASLGSAIWLAHILFHLYERRVFLTRALVGWVLGVPFVVGLFFIFGQEQGADASERAAMDSLELCDSAPEVWILNPPDHIIGFYLPLIQEQSLKRNPQQIRALNIGPRKISYRWIDSQLDIRSPDLFLTSTIERFWNIHPSSSIETSDGISIHVNQNEMQIVSEKLNSSSSICILRWKDSELQVVAPTKQWVQVERSISPSGL